MLQLASLHGKEDNQELFARRCCRVHAGRQAACMHIVDRSQQRTCSESKRGCVSELLLPVTDTDSPRRGCLTPVLSAAGAAT